MSYVYLGDLRNTHLGQASGSPEQLERAATGLEATAKGLRASASAGGPAASALNAQAQGLESQAAQLRRSAAQKRADAGVPALAQPIAPETGPSWLMICGIAAGLAALVGGGVWAVNNRKTAPTASRSTAVMAMNKGKAKGKKRAKR